MEVIIVRLPESAHTSRPWRIHEITRDFRLEDVWALPTPGGRDDFKLLVEGIASGDASATESAAARVLWALRWKLGELFGWDDPATGLDRRVDTLRDRLPPDLRAAPAGPSSAKLPFRSVYLLDDEWAAEIANQTVHGVMHIGWVPDGTGAYRGQMAVLVKPNGLFGRAYLAAIRPFRYLLVYPALLRQIGKNWDRRRHEIFTRGQGTVATLRSTSDQRERHDASDHRDGGSHGRAGRDRGDALRAGQPERLRE